jgi:hypothetical protein
VKKVLFVAALAAAVLVVVPAASAGRSHRVKLAVVVLPKSALGAAGRSLALSPDSGVVSNAEESGGSISGTDFSKLGRITGYALFYGDRYSGLPGITEISTGVDKYKNSRDARRGLAFWRKDDPKITVLGPYGLAVTVKALTPAKVGTRRFAVGTTVTVPGAVPLSLVDEQFTDGRYVLRAEVAAGSLSAANNLAGKLARKLDRRLRLAEAGRLRGKPVKVPAHLQAGPPPGGPDLSTLALTTADFGGQATIADQAYEQPSSPSLSEYTRDMQPAGNFQDLSQIIDWFPHANDATVLARFTGVELAYVFSQGLFAGTTGQFTPVDLSSVGDDAFGGTVALTQPGQPTVYVGIVALSAAQATDFVLVGGSSQIQSSDLVSLAQAAANRLNTGLAG